MRQTQEQLQHRFKAHRFTNCERTLTDMETNRCYKQSYVTKLPGQLDTKTTRRGKAKPNSNGSRTSTHT